jgi:hypothetical protein
VGGSAVLEHGGATLSPKSSSSRGGDSTGGSRGLAMAVCVASVGAATTRTGTRSVNLRSARHQL